MTTVDRLPQGPDLVSTQRLIKLDIIQVSTSLKCSWPSTAASVGEYTTHSYSNHNIPILLCIHNHFQVASERCQRMHIFFAFNGSA